MKIEEIVRHPEVIKLREQLNKYGLELGILVTGGGMVLLFAYGSALVANAILLAVLTTAGFVITAAKLPRAIMRWLVEHDLIADVVAAIGTYLLLGQTVTSLLAAAIVGIMTDILLWTAKPFILKEDREAVLEIEGTVVERIQ